VPLSSKAAAHERGSSRWRISSANSHAEADPPPPVRQLHLRLVQGLRPGDVVQRDLAQLAPVSRDRVYPADRRRDRFDRVITAS
jgi:hypothetical protein